jgi:hypothetical protein
VKKICYHTFFCSHKFHKIEYYVIFEMLKKKIWANFPGSRIQGSKRHRIRIRNTVSRAQPPPTCPSNGCCPHQKHYARGLINHWCIGIFLHKSPRVISGPIPPLWLGPLWFSPTTSHLPLRLGPPLILPLRLRPLCPYPSDSAPFHSPPPTLPPPHWRGGGETGEQCGNVTLLHCSPTPPVW